MGCPRTNPDSETSQPHDLGKSQPSLQSETNSDHLQHCWGDPHSTLACGHFWGWFTVFSYIRGSRLHLSRSSVHSVIVMVGANSSLVHSFSFFYLNSFIEIQLTYHTVHSFRCTVCWGFVYSQTCTTITTLSFRTFSSPQKETFLSFLHLHFSTIAHPLLCSLFQQPLIYLLSL